MGKHEELAGHPKWDVNIIIVANAAGKREYCKAMDNQDRNNMASELASALNDDIKLETPINAAEVLTWYHQSSASPKDKGPTRQECTTPPHLKRPKSHRKAKPEWSLPACARTTQLPATETLQAEYPAQPLRLNWRHLAYSDGSSPRPADSDRVRTRDAVPPAATIQSKKPHGDSRE